MPSYYYSSVAGVYTLTGAVNSSATALILDSVAGLPALTPYKVVLNPGESSEEIVKVTAVAGTTLTVVRGWNGTSAVDHAGGATVRHMLTAEDLTLSRTHEDTTAAHGATGFVVGTTNPQTLSNKDLTDGTNAFPANFVTTAGSQTLSNKVATAASAAIPAFRLNTDATRTADFLQFNDPTFGVVAKVSSGSFNAGPDGFRAYFNVNAGLLKQQVNITASAVDVRGLVVKGFAAQAANLQEWRKSDESVLASVDKDGNVAAANLAVVKSAKAGKRFDWQTFTGTTNATGLVTFTHSLGYVPTVILCTANSSSGNPKGFEPFNVTSTSITARFYTNETGSSYATSSVTANFFFGE